MLKKAKQAETEERKKGGWGRGEGEREKRLKTDKNTKANIGKELP